MMAITAFWLNVPWKGKMNGEMIFYFPGKGCWWQCVSTREGRMPRLLLNYSFQMKKQSLEWLSELHEGTEVEIGIKIQPFPLKFVGEFPQENKVGQYLSRSPDIRQE